MNYSSVSSYYKQTESIKRTAEHFNISVGKCRKILITSGDFSSPLSLKISELIDAGKTTKEIMDLLGKSNSTVNAHIPYSKGLYLSESPSKNALRIRKHRKKEAKTPSSYKSTTNRQK